MILVLPMKIFRMKLAQLKKKSTIKKTNKMKVINQRNQVNPI